MNNEILKEIFYILKNKGKIYSIINSKIISNYIWHTGRIFFIPKYDVTKFKEDQNYYPYIISKSKRKILDNYKLFIHRELIYYPIKNSLLKYLFKIKYQRRKYNAIFNW